MVVSSLVRMIFRSNYGSYVLDEAWDNLIILDACRFDVFEAYYNQRTLKGKLETRVSRGTDSASFLQENFAGELHDDIVYVTANPWVDKLLKGRFHRIISVWKEGWDEDKGTVLPKTMLEYAVRAYNDYPGKRLVVHFMQPHYPYLDPVRPQKSPRMSQSLLSIYSARTYASIPNEIHFRLYKRNLELAFPYVEELLRILPSTSVVTADHGDAFGERIGPLPFKLHGHLRGARIPALVMVPWLILRNPSEVRAATISEPSTRVKAEDEDEEALRERLRALGYE